MSAISVGDLGALALELYRSCREIAVDQYQSWTLDRFKTHVPFDAGIWASGHVEAHGPRIHNVHLTNRPLTILDDYEAIKHDDQFAFEQAANVGISVVANDLPRRPGSSPQMLEYLDRWRIEHAMGAYMVDPLTGLLTTISLWREDRSLPFDERERQFYGAALPHMIDTYTNNRMAHMLRGARPSKGVAYASASHGPEGELRVAPPAFQRCLLSEWPDWRGHRLPAQMRHLVAGRAQTRFVGRTAFFKAVRVGDAYLVQGRAKRPADQLTPREAEVARLAAGGLSQAEVAQHLTISTATVRNHLSAAYAKLGAHKRTELVSILREID